MIAGIFRLFLVLSVFVFNASVIAAQGVVNDSLEVSLIAPVEGNYSGDLLFNASSGDGVSSVWFGYAAPGDDVTWLPATKRTDGYWTYSFHTPDVDDGQYSVSVNGTDGNGNYSVLLDVVGVVVDNTLPDVSLVAPVEGNYTGNVLFNASVNDSGTGLESVRFGYENSGGGVEWFDGTDGGDGSWTATLDTADVTDGVYSLSVSGTDYAGNERVLLNAVEVVVDNDGPSIELVHPMEGDNLSGELLFNAYVTDSGTGVKRVWFLYKAQGGSFTVIP